MRKLMIMGMASLMVLAMAAPVAAGANVGNYSGGATLAQAAWESYDETTGAASYGYLVAAREQGETTTLIEFSESNETWTLCSDGGTPDDESDDSFGVVGTYRSAYGSGTLTVSKSYGSATAAGVLDVWTDTYDECAGTYDSAYQDEVSISLDLVATGDLVRESGRGSFHIPGAFNDHSSYRSTYRLAEGVVSIGDQTFESFGQIGKVSWSSHTNS
jgi:hypothetical protein